MVGKKQGTYLSSPPLQTEAEPFPAGCELITNGVSVPARDHLYPFLPLPVKPFFATFCETITTKLI